MPKYYTANTIYIYINVMRKNSTTLKSYQGNYHLIYHHGKQQKYGVHGVLKLSS